MSKSDWAKIKLFLRAQSGLEAIEELTGEKPTVFLKDNAMDKWEAVQSMSEAFYKLDIQERLYESGLATRPTTTKPKEKRLDMGKDVQLNKVNKENIMGGVLCLTLVDGQKITADRLLRHIEARITANNDCLEWTGTKNSDGYGRMFIGWNELRQPIRRFAHRVLYELIHGDVPNELDIDHLCRNRACVNPDHLEAVTRKENVRRGILPQMMRDKAANMTECKRGHPYREDNKVITNRKTGAKTCKICRNEAKRRAYRMKKDNTGGVRHGEVILIPRRGLVVKTTKKVKQYIVAHSESNHNHVIESETPFTVDEKNMYIALFGDSAIVHKKSFDAHETLTLEPAVYERYEAVEYDPYAQITRRVVD